MMMMMMMNPLLLSTGGSCAAGELSMKAMCYKKFYSSSPLSWFSASNQCLTRGGSLAVFSDIGRPSDNNQLTNWLNASGPDKSYWIGLVKSWWNTTDKGNVILLCSNDIGGQ